MRAVCQRRDGENPEHCPGAESGRMNAVLEEDPGTPLSWAAQKANTPL